MEFIWSVLAVILTVLTNIVCVKTIADRLGEDYSCEIEFLYMLTTPLTAAISIDALATASQDYIYINFWACLSALVFVPAFWIGLFAIYFVLKGFFRGFGYLLPRLSKILNKQIDRVFSLKKTLFNRSKRASLETTDHSDEIKRLEAIVRELSLKLELEPDKR